MKNRIGFVSNSSSSSFIVNKKYVSVAAMDCINNHLEYAKEHFPGRFYTDDYSGWSVDSEGDFIEFSTSMDNFDMREFLSLIGVSPDAIDKYEVYG